LTPKHECPEELSAADILMVEVGYRTNCRQ